MVRYTRYAYAALALLFVVGLVVQVFFIGLGMFGNPDGVQLHAGLGWILHLVPLLILVAAVLARAGRRHWLWALALAAVVFVVPILVLARSDAPVVAALHPVGAVLSFWLATVVARNALAVSRAPAAA